MRLDLCPQSALVQNCFFFSVETEIITNICHKNQQQIWHSRLVKPSDEFVNCQFTYLICLRFCGINFNPIPSTTIISYFEPCYQRVHHMFFTNPESTNFFHEILSFIFQRSAKCFFFCYSFFDVTNRLNSPIHELENLFFDVTNRLKEYHVLLWISIILN